MKKTSKGIGALALSATLALGCALPAFAADTDGYLAQIDGKTYSETDLENGSGEDGTTVGVKSYISNISVQVPLEAIVYADVVGSTTAGTGLKCPSADAYKLTNNSTSLDLSVAALQWEEGTNFAGWKIVDDKEDAKAGTPDSKLPTGANAFGNLYVTLKGQDMVVADNGATITGATVQLKSDKTLSVVTGSALNWVVPRQTVDASGTPSTDKCYKITMEGSNSQLLNQVKENTHMEVFKVKYTFAPNAQTIEGTADHS